MDKARLITESLDGYWRVLISYLNLAISVRLMASETLRALLHDLRSVRWRDSHLRAVNRICFSGKSRRRETLLDTSFASSNFKVMWIFGQGHN